MSLHKIEVRTGNYLEQIKFIFRNGEKSTIGSSKGKLEKVSPIMTENEYLVKVSHELYKNNFSIGLGITFKTNKGRIFDFYTSSLSTKYHSEMIHMEAEEGSEIVNLKIRKGVLQGITTSPVSIKENISQNYILSFYDKNSEKIEHNSYKNKKDANKIIKQYSIDNYLLIDFKDSKIIKDRTKTDKIIQDSIEKGYYVKDKQEKVNKLNILIEIFKEITTLKDFIPLIITNFFLTFANYFSLTANTITAKLLTLSDEKIKDNTLLYYLTSRVEREDHREKIILCLILIVFLQNVFESLNSYLVRKFKSSRAVEIKSFTLKHFLSLDQSFFDTNDKEEIYSSMNVEKFIHIIGWSIPTTIHKIIKLLMIIYFMSSISLEMTLMTCFIMIFLKHTLLEFLRLRNEKKNKIFRKISNLVSQINNKPKSIITTVKLFGSENYHIEENKKIQYSGKESNEEANIAEVQFSMTYHMLEVLSFSTIVYLGIKSIGMKIITPEELTSFFLIFKDLQVILGHINWHLRTLTKEFPEIEKFNWFLKSRPSIVNGEKIFNFNHQKIELQNVSFRYPSRPENKIIDDLSFSFKCNKTTAIVGDSGSGKSTISKLITRLYDPEEGRILLGNVNLKNYNLKTVLKNFSVVTQKPEFFVSTITENLKYSIERNITEEEIIQACKDAECYDFIMELPYKFETLLCGENLSGGQKQRLSIARAILKNPDFLILDEATSSLDSENEYKITKTLQKLMKNRTVIVIAHRLSTIKYADEIICLKKGKIIEKGTHDTLISSNSYYKKLIKKQL